MKRSLIAAVVSVLVIGCIPSLNPIYREKDIVFKPELLGTWTEGSDEDEAWVFERGEDQSYKLTYTDEEGREGEFVVHLADIKGHLFLDFFPGDLGDLKLNEINVVLLGRETKQGFAVTDEVGVRIEVVIARQSGFTIEKILNAAHIGVTGFNDLDDLLQYLGRDIEYFDLATGNSSAKVELFFLIRM